MELPRRYPYNGRWLPMIGGAVFFAGCGAVFVSELIAHPNGIVFHGIKLGATASAIFLGTLFVASMMFVVVALITTVRRITNPRILELGADAMTLPVGLFQLQTTRIAYSQIIALSELKVSGQMLLQISIPYRTYTLAASLLPDKKSYGEVRDFLTGVVSAELCLLKN